MSPTLMHDTWADTLTPNNVFTVPVYVGIYYSGAWHNISADVNELAGISITRGRSDESSTANPARLNLSLRNPTGTYSPRNPNSALYKLIGRNTPIEVWVYVGSAWHQRFYGEVTAWPQTWGLKGSTQAFAQIEAAGITRRLGQGASPLRSPLFRALSTLGSNLVGYWPCEDEDGATQYSVAVGSQPIYIKGTPSTANYDGFPSSEDLPTLEGASLTAMIPGYTSSAGQAQVRWVTYVPSTTTNNSVLMSVYFSGGTLARVDITWGTTGTLKAEGFDFATGASVGSAAYSFGAQNINLRLSLEMQTSGANIIWVLAMLQPNAASGSVGGGTFTGVTIGSVVRIVANPVRTTLTNVAFGHLTFERLVTTLFDVSSNVLAGYVGEEAANRIDRLCQENDVNVDFPIETDSQPMGVQGTDDLLSLLLECEATDGGILYEPRDDDGIAYRTIESLYSQADDDLVSVAYVDNMLLPFEPTEDDQGLRNKVTITRDGGSSSTIEETSNTLGTPTVGIYDEQVTLSLYQDIDTLQQAGWRTHLGTHDEARWPQIGCDLADPRIIANTTLRNNLIGIDIGTRLEVTSLPAWLPPLTVSQLVLGYTESIDASNWRIVFNCTPARPYRAAYYGATLDRYSGEGTVLAADATTTATSLTVTPPNGISWTHADGDYSITIDGEELTVTNVVGNTFTVTRSVNSVVKAHTSGAAVALTDPCYYGL